MHVIEVLMGNKSKGIFFFKKKLIYIFTIESMTILAFNGLTIGKLYARW